MPLLFVCVCVRVCVRTWGVMAEVNLRCAHSQLSFYSDKFEEFQRKLNKSNEVLDTFKKEMDKVLGEWMERKKQDRNVEPKHDISPHLSCH